VEDNYSEKGFINVRAAALATVTDFQGEITVWRFSGPQKDKLAKFVKYHQD